MEIPFFLSRRTIFCPVSSLILGTASLSLMATPICEGERPFLAMVTMRSVMLLGVCATQRAVLRLKGVTAELIPLPLPFDWILPIKQYLLNKYIAPKMKNRLSLAVLVRILPLTLPQRLETIEDALVFMGELLEGQSWQGGLLYSVTTVDSSLLLYSVFHPKGCDLQGLPANLSEVFLLGQRELLYIFGSLEEFDWSRVHPFLALRRSECLVVIEQQLVLAEYHEPFKEDIGHHFYIVVVVALHPLLDEVIVPICRQHYPVTAVGHSPQTLLNAGVSLNYGAFLHSQYPLVSLQSLSVHQLVQGLANGQVFPVAQHECRDEVVFVHGVDGIAEDFAVIAIKKRQLLTTITGATDYEGLIQHASGAEVVGQQLRDDEIDDVIITDGEDL